jgi:hypothetical protein
MTWQMELDARQVEDYSTQDWSSREDKVHERLGTGTSELGGKMNTSKA